MEVQLSLPWRFAGLFLPIRIWIDLKTGVIFKEDKIVAIYQEWLFDDFYSTALLEDAAKHPDGSEQGLHEEISAILSGCIRGITSPKSQWTQPK